MLACRKEAKEVRVQLKNQAERLSATAAARDEAAASARVVGEERAEMKREWSEMYAAHDGLQQRIAELQRRVAEGRVEAQVLLALAPRPACRAVAPRPACRAVSHLQRGSGLSADIWHGRP